MLFIAIMPACFVNLSLLLYFKVMRGFVALFIAIMPACFANLFVLSYFKKIKKEALMNIYALESNENSIMNIMRRKGH